jgi:hypothetical protein
VTHSGPPWRKLFITRSHHALACSSASSAEVGLSTFTTAATRSIICLSQAYPAQSSATWAKFGPTAAVFSEWKGIRSVQFSTGAEKVPTLMRQNKFQRRSQEAHTGSVSEIEQVQDRVGRQASHARRVRRMGPREWRKRFPGPTFFITGKDKGKIRVRIACVINPDSGSSILDSERQK